MPVTTTVAISDQRRHLEIIAVLTTGLAKFIFMDLLNWRLFYIATACLFWIGYVTHRYRIVPGILSYWGFTKNNFIETFKLLLPFGIFSVMAFFAIGHFLGTNILNWHILPLLILYPIWGTIQQFLMIALVAGNLKDMSAPSLPLWSIVLMTAILFAVVHYPFLWLIAGTFLLAIVYALAYLKMKNLFVLGLFHGWLGALFFYTVLARDPLVEVFLIGS